MSLYNRIVERNVIIYYKIEWPRKFSTYPNEVRKPGVVRPCEDPALRVLERY